MENTIPNDGFGKRVQLSVSHLSTLLEFSILWILGSIKCVFMILMLSIFGTWQGTGAVCRGWPPVLKEVARLCLSVLCAPILGAVVFVAEFGISGFSIADSFGKFSAQNAEQRKIHWKNIMSFGE